METLMSVKIIHCMTSKGLEYSIFCGYCLPAGNHQSPLLGKRLAKCVFTSEYLISHSTKESKS